MKEHSMSPLLEAARRGFQVDAAEETGLPTRHDAAGLSVRDEVFTAPSKINRRTVLELMAASSVLALGAGCDRKPPRQIVSMKDTPEYQHPGKALSYASAWTDGPVPYGMMVRVVDGRPVKIEGLPEHPLNRGAATAAMQASLLALYDPERLRAPQRGEATIGWDEADRTVVDALRTASKVVLLTRSTLGPTERTLVAEFLQACPAAKHFVHETVHDGAQRAAWKTAYGADGVVRPRLAAARVILSVDGDFLGSEGNVLGATADFAANRSPEGATPSRLYVAEANLSVTGSNADHRLAVRPSDAHALVQALRSALAGDKSALTKLAAARGLDAAMLTALVSDLGAHRGHAVVVAGSHLPTAVHLEVCLLNDDLGAPGATLEWCSAPSTLPVSEPAEIAAALQGGVDVLLCLGVNPAYDFPGGKGAEMVGKAKLSVGHGLRRDETLSSCHLALPSHHNLESWNDTIIAASVQGVCQPVISPLFESRQEADSLLAWTKGLTNKTDDPDSAGDWGDYLRRQWLTSLGSPAAPETMESWRDALRRGFHGTPTTESFPPLNRARLGGPAEATGERGEYELVLLPHHATFDGRFAGLGWLQEFPEPITKLVWDNAAVLSPATAKGLGVEDGDWLTLRIDERAVQIPVLTLRGVAAGVVAVTLGQGRTVGGTIGTGRGFNAAPLLGVGVGAGRTITNLTVQRTASPDPYPLVRTQKHFSMEGRAIALRGTRAEYEADPHFVGGLLPHYPEHKQLHGEWDYSTGHKWVMAIDMSRCTGCSACVVACQAENNVPIVGKSECANGREMHWLRMDAYYGEDEENPTVQHQPMLCQHCDNAPCENVCPVNATAHSPEGLNEQVYNRCIGTRYCANNCPYKVRRFNFFNYTKQSTKDPVQELAFNPQVTVRMRGVMEKCTFCVQRVNAGKYKADAAGRAFADGDVRTACQQTCPAEAIVFGDANDPMSKVNKLKASPLAYSVLGELNVRPNVNYLARVVNPHPDLAAATPAAAHDAGGDH